MLEDCLLARVGEFLERVWLGGHPCFGIVARFGNSGSMWANFSLSIEIVSVFVMCLYFRRLARNTLFGPITHFLFHVLPDKLLSNEFSGSAYRRMR